MMQMPIFQLNNLLVVTLRSDITDEEAIALKHEILVKIQQTECEGLLIDISVLELMDSFLGRVLNEIAEMARLMGAVTVITGMSPAIAITMVEFGLTLRGVKTALTVEKGVEWFRNAKTGA